MRVLMRSLCRNRCNWLKRTFCLVACEEVSDILSQYERLLLAKEKEERTLVDRLRELGGV